MAGRCRRGEGEGSSGISQSFRFAGLRSLANGMRPDSVIRDDVFGREVSTGEDGDRAAVSFERS